MKYVTHFFAILCALLLVGCGTANKNEVQSHNLGKQVIFENFWFSEFIPDTLSKNLNVDLTKATRPVKLQLYKKTEGSKEVAVKTSEAQLFLNSKKCQSNIITLEPGKHKDKVGLVFSSDALEGEHKFYVKVVDWGGLKRINSGTNDELFAWYATVIITMNPVKRNLIFAGSGLALLLILSVLISRLMYPSTKFTKLTIKYPDKSEREIKMAGRYELVCTSNCQLKDSMIKRLFRGKRQFDYDDFWTHDVVIKSGNGKKVRVLNLKDFGLSGDAIRAEEFIITNNQGKNVSIETN